MTLDLPRAEAWSAVPAVLVLDLFASGQVVVNGQTMPNYARSEVQVHDAVARHSDLRVILRVDASVPHGRVVRILDMLKLAGIEKIALGVTPIGPGIVPGPPVNVDAKPAPRSTEQPQPVPRWNCPFPLTAEGIDRGEAILSLYLDATGKVRWARILRDSGYGFGQAAAECAMKLTFLPARDANGQAVPGMSPPIRVRYAR